MKDIAIKDLVVTLLNTMEVDGETMEYIIKKVGMEEQMMRQLILNSTTHTFFIEELLKEKLELIK
jgi:hypothetical protein